MDETQSGGANWDAWTQAVLGSAISVAVDRVARRPQFGSDPAQAYGMDQNGNIYQLGQTNTQITAQVQTQKGGGTIAGLPSWLVIGGLVLLVVMEAK